MYEKNLVFHHLFEKFFLKSSNSKLYTVLKLSLAKQWFLSLFWFNKKRLTNKSLNKIIDRSIESNFKYYLLL